ncbi:MAG: hypothetical protein WD250_11910 [Egibacteraceae bacterium]
MTDNPLADWLRARQAALGGAEDAERADDATATVDAVTPRWPDAAAGAEAPGGPGTVRWDRPPREGGSHTPRRRRLLLIAALPWTVAVLLGGLALVTGGSDPDEVAAADQDATGPPAPGAAGQPPQPAGPVDLALGAAAVVAVRLAVTTAGDPPDGQERRYVDLAVPESVSWAGDLALVTIRAVVMEGPSDRWRSVRPARFAVPVGLIDGDAVVLDEPWALPVAEHPATDPGWTAADTDPGPLAGAAAAAGYADVEVLEVDAHPDRPALLRARIRARAPAEHHPRTHQLWLRADPEPAVLGLEPRSTHDDGRRP